MINIISAVQRLKRQSGRLLLTKLSVMELADRNQILLEKLHPIIYQKFPDYANKICEMLLEIQLPHLVSYLTNHEALFDKVRNIFEVFQVKPSSNSAPVYDVDSSTDLDTTLPKITITTPAATKTKVDLNSEDDAMEQESVVPSYDEVYDQTSATNSSIFIGRLFD